jgi:hypothetical protein
MADLEQVLVDVREELNGIAVGSESVKLDYVHSVLDRFRDSAEDFITWLSEPDAMLKSGLSERTLRRRFREMLDCGTARYGANSGGREYLAKCIPGRPNLTAARARGRARRSA